MAGELVDPEVIGLVAQLSHARTQLEKYADDLENLQTNVSSVFPKTLDARNRMYLDDKLKVVSTFYATLLSVRQEINKLIMNEIDVRRKITKDGGAKGAETDIRALADQLDKQGYKIQKLTDESNKLITLDIGEDNE